MDHIKVCRICLVMDVKMHDLQSYPLGTYFEPITGINVSMYTKFYYEKDRSLIYLQ